ncbi:MAG: DUF4258 domain-containing protein [Desulfobacterales bacterium]|uniref:DUF4258 domain-containing protein n=1 Tax=Candidatus Desulfatibia profunda TaxID=2841695 RepID=A0A8J6NX69_9BACT|nr:DUF4258 domain-containing protein [Candidatus Desulfatibia profunda]MBL7180379.1 DUF4258 domain-containing protein [Desulfobacterales bacterium]
MINYKLTHHAEDALVKRKIKKEWLGRVLAFPQRIEPDATDPILEHRLAEISECENRVLRVIINPHTNPIRVVTLFFDRKIRGKL